MLFFLFFTPFFCFSQLSESFSDGNFTHNPVWTGNANNFVVNSEKQLQSVASAASFSCLFTPSQAIENASWECEFTIDYPTSSSNYACMYIVSDKQSIENGFKGYFVQVGGSNDEVSLYYQNGTQKIKLIDGADKRTDVKPLKINVKVTRDSLTVFRLYSRLSTEKDDVIEGIAQDGNVLRSNYFGLSYNNTSTTGNCYSFDDIYVKGGKVTDVTSPQWLSLELFYPDTLKCVFSETMNFDASALKINGQRTGVLSREINEEMTEIKLIASMSFERGNVYQISWEGLTDLAGNILKDTTINYACSEKLFPGDIVFNEVMFHQPDSSFEYVEFYNRSEKLIEPGGLIFTTRKTDGTLNSGNKIPKEVVLFPREFVAFTSNPEVVRTYHQCPDEAKIIQTSWSSLNNESATLVLVDAKKDTVYDEFTYNVSMHHVSVKNPKGISLERIDPDRDSQDMTSWHSAAFTNNYGTPGFKNSQYLEKSDTDEGGKRFFLEKDVFSPDNDGVDDVCVLKYVLDEAGYVADVLILSATGERVFSLINNELLATSGELFWDGRNDRGKVAAVGIYVFFIEIIQPVKGKRKQFKIPVVLSSR